MLSEVSSKLTQLRESLGNSHGGVIRLRGVDWFSWVTGGGSSVILLTRETGIAEILVTARGAWALTSVIERDRLRDWEVPPEFEIVGLAWQQPELRESFVRERCGLGQVLSDRPGPGEAPLPSDIIAAKRRLLPTEIERYRVLGRDAADAMSATLRAARPDWTEWRLASEGARQLMDKGILDTQWMEFERIPLPMDTNPWDITIAIFISLPLT